MSEEKSQIQGYIDIIRNTPLPPASSKQADIPEAVQEELRLLRALFDAIGNYATYRRRPSKAGKQAWDAVVKARDALVRFEAATDKQNKAAGARGGDGG
jgi:hypothetical protein